VGVARQYSGTAGRIENRRIGVFLGYAGPKGHALIDRRLYLPKDRSEDAERRKDAGIPDDVVFATKPKIGTAMVEARKSRGLRAIAMRRSRTKSNRKKRDDEVALDAGVPCAWVLGDSVYGSDKGLRLMLERRDKPCVRCARYPRRDRGRTLHAKPYP